jgi:hypothetical protein
MTNSKATIYLKPEFGLDPEESIVTLIAVISFTEEDDMLIFNSVEPNGTTNRDTFFPRENVRLVTITYD